VIVRSLELNGKYFSVEVSENQKARHIAKRERYIFTRYPREKEIIKGCFALIVDQ
jgi:hypothetical protein